ncbi:hypothetical protein ASA1KI_45750 [Opitutales bacterium ASA1]|uniref:DUF4864 domain-containing protein n=1 Tax=Congregicoccus parvus TaxID=3081749 RepID=UPI002B2DA703|nr:hypothetical protein ASA1KI_45750 [Opitutales bacterium ASA1]
MNASAARRLLFSLVATGAILALTGCDRAPESAQELDPADVVLRQRAALVAGDYRAARSYAADELRGKFDDVAFGAMILRGYQRLTEPGRAVVSAVSVEGDQAFVSLRLEPSTGGSHWYRYALQREGDAWRIAGVVPFDPDGVML